MGLPRLSGSEALLVNRNVGLLWFTYPLRQMHDTSNTDFERHRLRA